MESSLSQESPLHQELEWWIKTWDTTIRNGQFWNADIPELLSIDPAADISYDQRRWLEARAQVVRILKETQLQGSNFFKGKVVMSVGPGPIGFLEACGARVKIGVEPLANAFRQHRLLLPDSDVVYLNTGAENIPLVDDFVDVTVCRNSLDHVEEPQRVIDEIWRVTKPNGSLVVNVDVEHETRPLEPHSFSVADVECMLRRFRVEWKKVHEKSHGGEGRMYVAVCVKP